MTTETLIYKYPKLKELFESQCETSIIMFRYRKNRIIPDYLNPYANITKYYNTKKYDAKKLAEAHGGL